MSEHRDAWRQAVEAIKLSADFVAIARDHFGLSLKRSGGEFVALCPFHDEKSPSFSINPAKGVFLCRAGCTPGGDLIRFVAKMQGGSDGQAIKWLSEHLSIPLPDMPKSRRHSSSPRKNSELSLSAEDERALLLAAADYYVSEGGSSEKFATFCDRRSITGDLSRQFRLGFAPEEPIELLRWLSEAVGVKPDDSAFMSSLGAIGLWRKSTNRPFFRNRIMFPVSDRAGNIVGFAGRRIDDKDGGPKYLNSPETRYFTKSSLLYGLQPFNNLESHDIKSWSARARTGTATVVEGYTDVIALADQGIWAVAAMGTAFSETHLRLLRQRTNNGTIIFCFDGDHAGQKAATRSANMLLEHYVDGDIFCLKVIPEGMDPDDYFRAGGTREQWDAIPEITLMEFWREHLIRQHDISTIEGRVRLNQELQESVLRLTPNAPVASQLLSCDVSHLVKSNFSMSPGGEGRSAHPWVAMAMKAITDNPEILGQISITETLEDISAISDSTIAYSGLKQLLSIMARAKAVKDKSSWLRVCEALLSSGCPPEDLLLWNQAVAKCTFPSKTAADIAAELPAIVSFTSTHGRLAVLSALFAR